LVRDAVTTTSVAVWLWEITGRACSARSAGAASATVCAMAGWIIAARAALVQRTDASGASRVPPGARNSDCTEESLLIDESLARRETRLAAETTDQERVKGGPWDGGGGAASPRPGARSTCERISAGAWRITARAAPGVDGRAAPPPWAAKPQITSGFDLDDLAG